MVDLIERLRGPIDIDKDCEERKEAAREIERLWKIVDALTVKLNKELGDGYQFVSTKTQMSDHITRLREENARLRAALNVLL